MDPFRPLLPVLLRDPAEFRALVAAVGGPSVAAVWLRRTDAWVRRVQEGGAALPLWAVVQLRRLRSVLAEPLPGQPVPPDASHAGDGAATSGPVAPAVVGRRPARPQVLLIGGSLNQTGMMHRIGDALRDDADCFFSPFYADGALRRAAEGGLLDFTILGRPSHRRTLDYLQRHDLAVDERGEGRRYDLVVTGTDLVVPRNVRGTPLVLVQEGMMDPETWRSRLVRALGLPRALANTAATGLSGLYAAFCVGSDGFRDLFVRRGLDPARLVVTGIPGFDDCAAYRRNGFPHRDYVLAATSCLRETLKWEDRRAFIERARRIADGRRLLFKLHPNERHDRARAEIAALAPEAEVFADGDTNAMIANCDALVTKYSSVMLVASALGKPVHCDLEPWRLRRLTPVQNGGRSAENIADVCRWLLKR